ncbi:MAG: hypothetical protein SVS15_01750 [Thermodesulfobacteriota bacterium]|nr:hypothetical protein [Thermodesulfobacteriota bacterium]
MRKVVFAALVLAVLFAASCVIERRIEGFRSPDNGHVFLYFSYPKKSAINIEFEISGMGFLDENGVWVEVPLEREIDSSKSPGGQIRLSEFYLPAGKYEQMKWKIVGAKMEREGETYSLALPEPEGEYVLDVEFALRRRESLAFFLDWTPDESIEDKYLFSPKIAARKQGIEIRDLSLYVTNEGSDCVTVMDRQRDKVVAAVTVGRSPRGIVANPDKTKVYVANFGSNNFSVIDTSSNQVVNTISNFGRGPVELAVSADGTRIFAVNPESDSVSVVDTATEMVVGQISVGDAPAGIVFDQDRSRVYVANSASNTISIIDVASSSVERTVAVGLHPVGLAVHDGRLYVANRDSNNISVMDIPSYSVATTIPVERDPLWIQSGLSGRIYLSGAGADRVYFIYASTNKVVRDVRAGRGPLHMAVDTLRRKLYVVGNRSDDVSVVDLVTRRVKAVMQVGRRPHGIAVVEE